MYKSTSRDEQIRVNESYREEQNNAVERSQQKQRENTSTNKENINSSTREKIDNLKKDLKYMKETLKSITSRQWIANKKERSDNEKEINWRNNRKIVAILNKYKYKSNKYKESEMEKTTATNYNKLKQ